MMLTPLTFGIIKAVGCFFFHNRLDCFSHHWSGGIQPHMCDRGDNVIFGRTCSWIRKDNKYCSIRLVADLKVFKDYTASSIGAHADP